MQLCVELLVLDDCTRGEDAGHLAPDKAPGSLGILDLVADDNVVALVEKLACIGFYCVPGHAAHGNGVGGILVAAGKGKLQLAGCNGRVLEEEFVEVAHAVEEEGVRIVLFDGKVLFEHGGDTVAVSPLDFFVPALIAVAVGALVLGFRAFGHGVFLFVWMCAAFGGKENKHGGGEFSAATKFAGCGVSLPLPPRRLG